eukprot:1742702-Prorocentrum_lima.AAC.1
MTSSLVGSEMCIRDRLSSLASPLALLSVFRRFPISCRTFEVAGPSVAVSYTHLTLPTICSV